MNAPTYSSITEVTQYRDAWIPLGRGCYVRASEVVVVLPPSAIGFSTGALAEATARHIRSVVALRCGKVVPSFVTAATVIGRLRAVQP